MFQSIGLSTVSSPDAAIGIVSLSCELTMYRPTRNSFQMKMTPKVAATRMPGRASGSRTRSSTNGRVRPSTIAASSISRGISSKKPIMIQTTSGKREGDVGEDQPRERVHQAEVPDHQEDRDRDRDRRHEPEAEDRRGPRVAAAEAQAREGIGRGHAEHERDQRRDAGDDDRVLDEREVVVVVDDLAVVVLDRRPVEVERRRHLDEGLELRLEREDAADRRTARAR